MLPYVVPAQAGVIPITIIENKGIASCTRTGGGDPVRIDKNGQKSQKLFNDKVSVSINPDTGNLIQVNPYNR